MNAGQPRRVIRRLGVALLDLLLAFAIGFLCSLTPVGTFFARRAVVTLRIGSPDTLWKGLIPMLMGIAGTFVYSLPLAFLVVSLVRRRPIIQTVPWAVLTLALLAGSWPLAVVGIASWVVILGLCVRTGRRSI